MKRGRNTLESVSLTNAGGRSGLFALDGDPNDDHIIGGETFVSLWSGMYEMQWINTSIPPITLINYFYYEDTLPYHWS